MGFFDDRENLGPPPEPFRSGTSRGEPRSPIPLKWVGIAAAILVAYLILNTLKSIYIDYLWFDSVGFASVYQTVISAQIVLFLIGAGLTVVVLGINIWLARTFAPRGPEESFIEDVDPDAIRRIVDILLVAGVLFMAVIFGSVAAGSWEIVLRWLNGVEFGVNDPQFGLDISFYVFDLPAYQFFHGWVMGLVIVSALAAGAVYGLTFSLQRFELNITRGMRVHLSILGGLVLLLIALSTFLGIYELISSPGGLIYGGTYTDINARLPVRYILVALAAFAGIATIANAFLSRNSFRIPLFAFGLWAFAGLVGGVLYPQAVQSFQVDPNEFQREAPYIERNMEATRAAWGLDQIDPRRHPAEFVVSEEELEANPETLANIRLLDPTPLEETLNQLQTLRPLYRFPDIDISRYPLVEDEADQQVLISARELDLARVPDRNWTRDRLQLTHGFGAIATPVTEVEEEGLPRLMLLDIPPRTEQERLELTIDGSRIYFGELTHHYVVVNTHELEFDYPDPQQEGRDVRTAYEHDRGIPLSSLGRRFLLAWELGDINLLISGQIHDDSRLLMHRHIQERVAMVAPFLVLDHDPYVMVIDGRLQWMQPAYTVADTYPYSQPRAGVNYIRNSVQIVMDAGTGDMHFYLMDPDDPIVQTWAGIFPELFTPVEEMPDAVRQQLRYPLDMFRIQAQHYQQYHVTTAEVFFTGEDFWELPRQRGRDRVSRAMEPYYVTMRLPGEDRVEFILIMPFTPRGERDNTVAWLAGRSDGEHFGSLVNYRFPTGALVFGPAQIENRIEQNALISQQLTLWDTAGSEVVRPTLMMVPLGDSFLYVQPVYLQAAGGRMPELRRVIVANGNAVAMEETFEEALDVVMGRRAPTGPEFVDGVTPPIEPGETPPEQPTPAPPAGPAGSIEQLLQQARQSSDATQRELDQLRQILEEIEQQLNQQQQQ